MGAAFLADLATYIALGDSAISIVTKMISSIMAIRARGRPPTQSELNTIATEARTAFEALPKPRGV